MRVDSEAHTADATVTRAESNSGGAISIPGALDDPLSRHEPDLLNILFDRMPVGIALLDKELVLLKCNRAWAEFLAAGTKMPVTAIVPGKSLFELIPGVGEEGLPLLDKLRHGETVRNSRQQVAHGGIVSYWDITLTPIMDGDQVVGVVDMVNDVTERVLSEQSQREAEEAAVAADRTRLARDLHDSVTQTLFSASLIAEVLPRVLERNPKEGQRRLGELRQLTRGALAEMRALLLELRPAALTEASLADLLKQLTEAIAGRARLPVSLEVTNEGECHLPPDVQIAFYRIAQEALNNVYKHSGASEARVMLTCSPTGIEMCICDNGHGFDTRGLSAEHMGLRVMRERAESAGAYLSIESHPSRGTEIRVGWTDEEVQRAKEAAPWSVRGRGRAGRR